MISADQIAYKIDAQPGALVMKLLRMRQVMQMTGLSRMTLYRLERAGHFPNRRRLAENSVAWLESEVAQWIESRPVASLRPHLLAAGHRSRDARARRPNKVRDATRDTLLG